jgi:hypothetical protein
MGGIVSTSPGTDGIATGGQSSTIQFTSPQKPNTLTYTVIDPLNVVGDAAPVTGALLDPTGKPVPNQPVTFTLRDPATGSKITDYFGTTNAQVRMKLLINPSDGAFWGSSYMVYAMQIGD